MEKKQPPKLEVPTEAAWQDQDLRKFCLNIASDMRLGDEGTTLMAAEVYYNWVKGSD